MENGGRAWDRFMRRLNRKSGGTQKIYLNYINQFFDHIGMDAQAFYELRREGWKSKDPLDGDEVEEMVSDYVQHLKAQSLSPGTISNYLKPIALFLKTIKMPLDMGEVNAPRKIYNGQRKIASKQIKVMLQKAGTEFYERNRGMIMMAKDTGLRMSDLSEMDLEHYASSQLVEADVGPFRVFKPIRTKKTGDLAHIRIGPEAIEAIDTWLKIRGHDSGPLFTKRGGGRLSRKGSSALFLRKSHHLEDGYKISGHSFRKFHKTSLEGAGMNENWIRRLQGKAHDVYSAPSEEELTEAYMNAYDRLRILGEPAAFTAKELETLKSENALLQDRIERLEQRIDQGYGSPRALIEMLRKEGLVTVLESKSQDKSKSGLPHRRPLER